MPEDKDSGERTGDQRHHDFGGWRDQIERAREVHPYDTPLSILRHFRWHFVEQAIKRRDDGEDELRVVACHEDNAGQLWTRDIPLRLLMNVEGPLQELVFTPRIEIDRQYLVLQRNNARRPSPCGAHLSPQYPTENLTRCDCNECLNWWIESDRWLERRLDEKEAGDHPVPPASDEVEFLYLRSVAQELDTTLDALRQRIRRALDNPESDDPIRQLGEAQDKDGRKGWPDTPNNRTIINLARKRKRPRGRPKKSGS